MSFPPPRLTPKAQQLTSSASATVMSTAQPAMPARPMRCRVRRPARSTTNSCGQRQSQCHPLLVPLWPPPPPIQRLIPTVKKAKWHCLLRGTQLKDHIGSEGQRADSRQQDKGESQPETSRRRSILAVTLGKPLHFSEHQYHGLFDVSNELDRFVRMRREHSGRTQHIAWLAVNAAVLSRGLEATLSWTLAAD